MKLIKVEFVDYKSITGDDLDVEKDITCLVGVNESGKSNVLLALGKADVSQELVQDEISRHSKRYETDSTPGLKLFFEVEENEQEEISEIFGGIKVPDIIVLFKEGTSYRLDYPNIDYKSLKVMLPNQSQADADQENNQVTEEEENTIRNQVVNKLLEKIPRFLRFDSVDFNQYFLPGNGEIPIDQFLQNPENFRPIKNLLYLGGYNELSWLQATDTNSRIRRDTLLGKASQKVNKQILRLVWPVDQVEIEMTAGDNILNIRLKESGKPHPFKPEERSRGLQWALAFNIYFLAETRQELSNSILLIDEPGIFLHIDGQKKLLEQTLSQIIKQGNQIVYTTHLPYLINPEFPQRIRILERENGTTTIGNKAWSQGDFGIIPEPVKTALGLDWDKVFLFKNTNVVVEGPSDQVILQALKYALGYINDASFVPAYGSNKMPAVLAIAKISGNSAIGLVDGDQDIDDLRNKCKQAGLSETSLISISEITNSSVIQTIEDLVPEDLMRKSVFKAYERQFKRRKNAKLNEQEIPLSCPRVDTLEKFFASKLRAKSHKLNKMDIARQVSLLIEDNKVNHKHWSVAKKVLKKLLKSNSAHIITKPLVPSNTPIN